MLPEVSGFDVLSAMRKDDRWRNIPVIILTNLSDDKDVEHGKELGASDYLVKANMNIADVISRVKQELKV
jgi:putative two-component system response regulator